MDETSFVVNEELSQRKYYYQYTNIIIMMVNYIRIVIQLNLLYVTTWVPVYCIAIGSQLLYQIAFAYVKVYSDYLFTQLSGI